MSKRRRHFLSHSDDQCDRKEAYATSAEAVQTLKKSRYYQHSESRFYWRVYRCPECDWYHIGHNRQAWREKRYQKKHQRQKFLTLVRRNDD